MCSTFGRYGRTKSLDKEPQHMGQLKPQIKLKPIIKILKKKSPVPCEPLLLHDTSHK